MLARPLWSEADLEAARLLAIQYFRDERLLEPLEAYLDHFDRYQLIVVDLLEQTVDLSQIRDQAVDLLSDEQMLEAVRYLTGPPISADDLKVVAQATLSPKQIRADDAMVRRIAQVVVDGLDRRRFPWIAEAREPTQTERAGAVIATAALIATRKTETARRNEGKTTQEDRVREALGALGLRKVPTRQIDNAADFSERGTFCGETMLGTRKADFVVALFDGRLMPIECKVSNSSTNSVKRLNNDAAAKAETWRKDFGERNVVPVAVLSGVYKLHNLIDAQERGLTLFWAHDLGGLTEWIEKTRS